MNITIPINSEPVFITWEECDTFALQIARDYLSGTMRFLFLIGAFIVIANVLLFILEKKRPHLKDNILYAKSNLLKYTGIIILSYFIGIKILVLGI